jgi:hypothetical protein
MFDADETTGVYLKKNKKKEEKRKTLGMTIFGLLS